MSRNSNAVLRESEEDGGEEGERVGEVGARGEMTRAVGGREEERGGGGGVGIGEGEGEGVGVGGKRSVKGCAVGIEVGSRAAVEVERGREGIS